MLFIKAYFTLVLFLSLRGGWAQPLVNQPLKQELDRMYALDQQYRAMLFAPRLNRRPDSLARALGVAPDSLFPVLMRRMQQADAANLRRVEALLQQYGYPGRTLVGEPTNEVAWSIIQHSPKIKQYLPLIKSAARQQELPFYLYAQMLDRQLMTEGREQLYGTQGRNYNTTNPATGQRESQPPFIWPIKDPPHVNERRKKAGFEDTVEQSAADMGIPYRVLTLEEVAKMPKE